MNDWLNQLRTAEKIITGSDNSKTVIYKFPNGKELKEEYNVQLNVVTRRAWRVKDKINEEWDVELGEPMTLPEDFTTIFIKENPSEPQIWKRNTRKMIEWRIKNLPYPSETYSVACNQIDKSIIVQTTNSKYYKVLRIPELERLGLLPVKTNLSFTYNRKTLIIKYIKPQELIEFDKAVFEMVKELKPRNMFEESDKDQEPAQKKRKIIEL